MSRFEGSTPRNLRAGRTLVRRLSAAMCWCSLIPTVCFSLAPADLDYSKSQSFNNAQSTRPIRQIAEAKPTRISEPERLISGGKAVPSSRCELTTFGPNFVFFRPSENPSSCAPFRTPLARNMITPFLIACYRSFGIIAEHFSTHEDDRICVSITCAQEIAYSKQRFGKKRSGSEVESLHEKPNLSLFRFGLGGRVQRAAVKVDDEQVSACRYFDISNPNHDGN